MNRCEKIPAVLMAAGLLSAVMPQYAKASDIDDLDAKVQQLSAQVDQLKKQQDAAAAAMPGKPAKPVVMSTWRPWTPPNYTAPGPSVNNGPLSASIFGATFTPFYGDMDVVREPHEEQLRPYDQRAGRRRHPHQPLGLQGRQAPCSRLRDEVRP